MSDRPEQRPEGRLIALAQKRARISGREAARRVGISEARWRHIISGYRPEAGHHIPVRAPAETLARMAEVVGVTPDQLIEANREDAAEALRAMSAGEALRPPTASEIAELREQLRQIQRRLDQITGVDEHRDAG